MSRETTQVEAVDHRAQAEHKLRFLNGGGGDVRNDGAIAYALCAQAEASLAIAEQLERLNETLAATHEGRPIEHGD